MVLYQMHGVLNPLPVVVDVAIEPDLLYSKGAVRSLLELDDAANAPAVSTITNPVFPPLERVLCCCVCEYVVVISGACMKAGVQHDPSKKVDC